MGIREDWGNMGNRGNRGRYGEMGRGGLRSVLQLIRKRCLKYLVGISTLTVCLIT